LQTFSAPFTKEYTEEHASDNIIYEPRNHFCDIFGTSQDSFNSRNFNEKYMENNFDNRRKKKMPENCRRVRETNFRDEPIVFTNILR
jgi:hypothetical protein